MRIAVLVYGRLNKCVEHYENIMEMIGKQHDIDFFLSSDNSSESLLNDFIQLYKPKMYNNDQTHYDYDISKYTTTITGFVCNYHNITCHFINTNRVFLLLEEYINKEKVEYDVVISLRIDLVFRNHFNFDIIQNNTVYIPYGFDYRGINDQMAYGNIDVMKKYNCIDVLYLLEQKLSIPHPETLNRANIEFHHLEVEKSEFRLLYRSIKNIGII